MSRTLTEKDWSPAFRVLGLILVGLGAFIAGASQLSLEQFVGDFSFGVKVGAAVFIASLGVIINGFAGLAIFAIGNVLLGSVLFYGAVPPGAVVFSVVALMGGFALRVFTAP